MTPAALQTFIAVTEHGSISAAAEALHVSQPAASKRIRLLEESLRVELFDRIGRDLRLTEAGRVLLPHARRIISDIELTRREIDNLSGSVGGRLQLATSHHVGIHRLPPVLRQFTQSYPDVALDLKFMDSEQAVEGVLAAQLELALVTLPRARPESLSAQVVWNDTLWPVVAPDHPLASETGLVSIAALRNTPAVLPGAGTITRDILLDALGHESLRVLLETNYLETIKMLVSVGLGWGVVPDTMIDESLHILPTELPPMQRKLGVIMHRRRTPGRAAQALLGVLGLGEALG